ncbi:hypothetical protein PINS_up010456 [Pythium insidiosum]|nr:hypothetical protein PINS_up010456 [Pythium insidiosum]
MDTAAPLSPRRDASRAAGHRSSTDVLLPSPRHPSTHGSPQHRVPKLSPRHVRLQSVMPVPTSIVPTAAMYGAASLRDHIRSHMRHELFTLHQLLEDAVQSACSNDAGIAATVGRTRSLFAVLTSDHKNAVLREFFAQWQRLRSTSTTTVRATAATTTTTQVDEQDLLCAVLDALLRNLPLVVTEQDLKENTVAIVRCVDAMRSLRDVLRALLFRSSDTSTTTSSSIEPSLASPDDDPLEMMMTKDSSSPSPFASTVSLLSLTASSSSLPSPRRGLPAATTTATTSTERRRVPLYVHCEQLERELEELRRRLRNFRMLRPSGKELDDDEIGLLNDNTVTLLLQFWELPRTERLGFIAQVASQSKQDDLLAFVRVFLDQSTTDSLMSTWDVLSATPHLQHALEQRKALGQTADATALDEAELKANDEQEKRLRQRGDGSDDGDDDDDDDDSSDDERRRRTRGKRRSGAIKGAHARASRVMDLSSLTDIFENDEDGFGDGSSARKRRHKMRVRERGRTPDGDRRQRGHQDLHHHRQQHQQQHHGHTQTPQPPPSHAHSRHADDGRTRDADASDISLLNRVHADLIELLQLEDDNDVPPPIHDAAWKLVEAIDLVKRKETIPKRQPHHHRKLSSFKHFTKGMQQQQQPTAVEAVSATPTLGAGDASLTHRNSGFVIATADMMSATLTTEQQYLMKVDQLHSLLATLGSFTLHAMSTETITAAYKRMPVLNKLFQAFIGKTYEAVGIEPPTQQQQHQQQHQQHQHHPSAPAILPSREPSAQLPPTWNEELMVESVELMLGKLGQMVRSLAPLSEIRSDASNGGTHGGLTSASAEILRLADAMDDMARNSSNGDQDGHDPSLSASGASSAASSTSTSRRMSMDPAKRLMLLRRLKSLAQSNQIESITGLITSTCDELVTLKTIAEHQQQQLELLSVTSSVSGGASSTSDSHDTSGAVTAAAAGSGSGSTRARKRTQGRTVDAVDSLGRIDDGRESEGDDVIKLAKQAKLRRASAAAAQARNAAASESEDVTETIDEADEGDVLGLEIAGVDDRSAAAVAASGGSPTRIAFYRDIPMTIKQATAQRGSKLFNVGILLRVIDQMYRENYETMVSSLQYGSRRMEFSEFMYDWHIRKYGLKALAQQHLLKLIQSLRKYEKKVFQCQLCLRFLGILSPLGYHEHKFVLGLIDRWSAGSFSGPAKHRLEYTHRQFKLRIPFAIVTVQEALSDRFGIYFRTMDAVSARIKSMAMRADEEFVKETDVLTVAIEEYLVQRQRLGQILEAVYTAGDLNGDGSLEYEEFAAVMFHLAPSLDDKFVQKVFAAAHDFLKPRRISFERFIDVILLERVLGFTVNGGKSASFNAGQRAGAAGANRAGATAAIGANGATGGATGGVRPETEDEEAYQFKLLQETWEHDREIVSQVLGNIRHQQTAASIQFRVTFLTHILEKRVDSKTAWMCHRQIMREISRYQNLNEEQIVVLKKKEETFKKAVMAIRNLQRLSVVFLKASTRRASSNDESEAEQTAEPTETTSPGDGEGDVGDGASTAGSDMDYAVSDRPITGHSSSSWHPVSKQSSYARVVDDQLRSAGESGSNIEVLTALEERLRQMFLEEADEGAIEDYMTALAKIRRLSVQALPTDDYRNGYTLEEPTLTEEVHPMSEEEAEEDGDEEEEEEEDGDAGRMEFMEESEA